MWYNWEFNILTNIIYLKIVPRLEIANIYLVKSNVSIKGISKSNLLKVPTTYNLLPKPTFNVKDPNISSTSIRVRRKVYTGKKTYIVVKSIHSLLYLESNVHVSTLFCTHGAIILNDYIFFFHFHSLIFNFKQTKIVKWQFQVWLNTFTHQYFWRSI